PASCSFNMPMICSSVKRLRFILWSSQMGQSLLQNGLFQRGKVTAHTVNEYLQSATKKLNAINRTQAAVTATMMGLL
ncbi:hypothetical protein HFN06_30890, partial [Rhizobium leguminosarum]|nr:hypothetical protein [Rhizobium leguminosarum]